MVKPGGTGRPRLAISARLAPLPPSRSRMLALPSALPSPNVNTHLPEFAAAAAGFAAAGFVGLFVNTLRAPEGGAVFRTGADGFDFVAAFLVFEAALAMALDRPPRGKERKRLRALHHVLPVPCKLRNLPLAHYICSHFSAPTPIRPT